MWASLLDEKPHIEPEAALEDEHSRLVELLTDLRVQITNRSPVEEQRFALHLMDAALRINCLSEEAVMEDRSYPYINAHKDEHRSHYQALQAIEQQIIALETGNALLALEELQTTLVHHIHEKDQAMVAWERDRRHLRAS